MFRTIIAHISEVIVQTRVFLMWFMDVRQRCTVGVRVHFSFTGEVHTAYVLVSRGLPADRRMAGRAGAT